MTPVIACGLCTEVANSAIPAIGMVGLAVSYLLRLFRRRNG
jgi:hypothetical protein